MRMTPLTRIAFLGCAAFVLSSGISCSRPASLRHVVLISIDSLRADHVGCYGYARSTTPHIDRLARDGVFFRTAVSTSSWTLPAHMSLLTGLLPEAHGAQSAYARLDPARTLLQEILSREGLRTAGFVSSPFLSDQHGFARGFETYRNFWEDDAGEAPDSARATPTIDDSHDDRTGTMVVAHAVEWLRHQRRDPFFLFVHLWEPHYDYVPPAPYDTLFFAPGRRGSVPMERFFYNEAIREGMVQENLDYVISQYDGEVAYADHLVGQILDALAALGLDKDTFIVLTADHGDEFFEHGGKGHQRTLFDEVVLVPLVVRGPGVRSLAQGIDTQVSLIDVAPTVLSLLGIPRGSEMTGSDVSGLFMEGGPSGAAAARLPAAASAAPAGSSMGGESEIAAAPLAVSQLEGARIRGMKPFCRWFAVRSPQWKTVRDCSDSLVAFDLVHDPGERAPLSEGGKEWLEMGRASAAAQDSVIDYASGLSRKGTRRVRLAKEQEERLRSLGYTN